MCVCVCAHMYQVPTLSKNLVFISKVHHAVYDRVEAEGAYDSIRSTRHFGGLVWYLVQQEKMVGLVKDMVDRSL